MSDHITDPHASGLDHGLTSALHSPLAPAPAPKIWECKIGEVHPSLLPRGGDGPMRAAVERAYFDLTGVQPAFCFSGWGAELTEPERAVVENRLPSEDYAPDDRAQEIIDLGRAVDWAKCEITTLTTRAEAAEAVAEMWRKKTEQARAEVERQRTNNRHGREECGKLHARIEGMRETGRAQIAETQALRAEVARLASQLAECYRLTGADPDGDSDAMLAKHAVAEVRQLREESDAEIEQLESERNRLAGIVRAVIEATGTDPDAVDLRHVVAAELAEHVASLREPNVAADLRTQALAADSSRLRAAVEGYHKVSKSIPYAQWTPEMHRAAAALSPAPGARCACESQTCNGGFGDTCGPTPTPPEEARGEGRVRWGDLCACGHARREHGMTPADPGVGECGVEHFRGLRCPCPSFRTPEKASEP